MTDEVRFIGNLARLEIKPGDKFVLQSDQKLSLSQIEAIKAAWKGFHGDEGALLILDAGLRLGLVGPVANDGPCSTSFIRHDREVA